MAAQRASRRLSRRVVMLGGALAGASAVTAAGVRRQPDLLSEGLVVGADGVAYPLLPGDVVRTYPGTPVAAGAAQAAHLAGGGRGSLSVVQADAALERLAASFSARVLTARLPTGRWAGLAGAAMSDLLALTGPRLAAVARDGQGRPQLRRVTRFRCGAVVAGPVTYWRYVWPRDAAYAAVALCELGLEEEAHEVLEHLAWLSGGPGGAGRWTAWSVPVLQARYGADGRAPDGRGTQVDGVGWLAWAAGWLARRGAGPGTGPTSRARLGLVLSGAGERLLALTAGASPLPPVSPDYWEVPESRLTLGTALAVLLGLEGVACVGQEGRDPSTWGVPGELVEQCARRAGAVRQAVEEAWAPAWGRHAGDDRLDAAVVWALPPFTRPLEGVGPVRARLERALRRPVGGVAPGQDWRADGVAWTPQTALVAWSAAALARSAPAGLSAAAMEEQSARLLAWLEAHRTRAGSLPEKVRADGGAAGPAPLAWTSAVVVLAALFASGECERQRA